MVSYFPFTLSFLSSNSFLFYHFVRVNRNGKIERKDTIPVFEGNISMVGTVVTGDYYLL